MAVKSARYIRKTVKTNAPGNVRETAVVKAYGDKFTDIIKDEQCVLEHMFFGATLNAHVGSMVMANASNMPRVEVEKTAIVVNTLNSQFWGYADGCVATHVQLGAVIGARRFVVREGKYSGYNDALAPTFVCADTTSCYGRVEQMETSTDYCFTTVFDRIAGCTAPPRLASLRIRDDAYWRRYSELHVIVTVRCGTPAIRTAAYDHCRHPLEQDARTPELINETVAFNEMLNYVAANAANPPMIIVVSKPRVIPTVRENASATCDAICAYAATKFGLCDVLKRPTSKVVGDAVSKFYPHCSEPTNYTEVIEWLSQSDIYDVSRLLTSSRANDFTILLVHWRLNAHHDAKLLKFLEFSKWPFPVGRFFDETYCTHPLFHFLFSHGL